MSEFKITIEGDHIISCLGKGHLGTARTVGKDDKQPPSINSRQLFITKEASACRNLADLSVIQSELCWYCSPPVRHSEDTTAF